MIKHYIRKYTRVIVIILCFAMLLATANTAQASAKLPNWTFNEPLYGVNFSPFEKDPNLLIHVVDVPSALKRLSWLKGKVKWIRFFGLDRNQSEVVAGAKRLGFKVAVGAWISSDQESSQKQIDELIKLIKAKKVDLAVVGNEVLDAANGVSQAELIAYIHEVKVAAKGHIAVTTAAGPAVWQSKPELVKAVDVIGLNVYPFWAKTSIDSALEDFTASYASVKSLAGGKQVIVTETGWPSAGGSNGNAVGSLANAQQYLNAVSVYTMEHSIPLFWFSAEDEPWKTKYEQQFGAHWGLYDTSGKQKLTLYSALKRGAKGSGVTRLQTRLAELGYYSKTINGTLDSSTVAAIRSFQLAAGVKRADGAATTLLQLKLFAPGAKRAPAALAPVPTPAASPEMLSIEDIRFPSYGKSGFLTGRVAGAADNIYIVVYIQVGGSWWVKPYWDTFVTTPGKNGTFSVDVDTGGLDYNATAYEIYLLDEKPSSSERNVIIAKAILCERVERTN